MGLLQHHLDALPVNGLPRGRDTCSEGTTKRILEMNQPAGAKVSAKGGDHDRFSWKARRRLLRSPRIQPRC